MAIGRISFDGSEEKKQEIIQEGFPTATGLGAVGPTQITSEEVSKFRSPIFAPQRADILNLTTSAIGRARQLRGPEVAIGEQSRKIIGAGASALGRAFSGATQDAASIAARNAALALEQARLQTGVETTQEIQELGLAEEEQGVRFGAPQRAATSPLARRDTGSLLPIGTQRRFATERGSAGDTGLSEAQQIQELLA